VVADVVEEAAHERALAHARAAVDEDARGCARRGALERGLEDLAFGAPADERRALRAREHGAAAGGHPQPAQHVRTGGPVGGLAAEQIHAQRLEILGRVGHERARPRRIQLPLGHEHLHRRAHEGQAAGERLVEHRADRVPVARLGERGGGALFGRHVAGGADDRLAARARVEVEIGEQAEVEEHDAAGRRDQDVRRLEVAVQLAQLVQGRDAGGELVQRRAQAGQVDRGARRPRRGGGFVGPGGRGRRRAGQGVLEGARLARADPAEEVDAVDELHGDEPVVALADQLAQADQVHVVHVGERAELLLEAEQRVRLELAQHLEGHAAAVGVIDRLVDDAHAAGADPPEDLEALRAAELLGE
jgi:hypothetical protein